MDSGQSTRAECRARRLRAQLEGACLPSSKNRMAHAVKVVCKCQRHTAARHACSETCGAERTARAVDNRSEGCIPCRRCIQAGTASRQHEKGGGRCEDCLELRITTQQSVGTQAFSQAGQPFGKQAMTQSVVQVSVCMAATLSPDKPSRAHRRAALATRGEPLQTRLPKVHLSTALVCNTAPKMPSKECLSIYTCTHRLIATHPLIAIPAVK